ncbi:universal stress protein [Thalassobacillus devorans]|uniref:universal stress protein n=1 Tax=Thalassobacillus devorans TaxID=279813 RepID=UPI00048DE638|nr:universal stress protein [Thalassobacillus devorans]
MKQNYLVPVDGSDHSLRALAYAIEHAKETDNGILLVHVQPEYDTHNIRRFITKEQIKEYQQEMADEAFLAAEPLLSQSDVTVEKVLLTGVASDEICRLARKEKVKGIIMGSRGLGRVKGSVLGSISYSVLHTADVPVTVVP